MPTLSSSQLPAPKSWDEFEQICADLWKKIWSNRNIQRQGRQGQQQNGVDISGELPGKQGWGGIQCKCKDQHLGKKLSITEMRAEVKEAKSFEPPLAAFLFATTGPRDVECQAEARRLTMKHKRTGLFSVHVWSWEDIVSELVKYPCLLKLHYPSLCLEQEGIISNAIKLMPPVQKVAFAVGLHEKLFPKSGDQTKRFLTESGELDDEKYVDCIRESFKRDFVKNPGNAVTPKTLLVEPDRIEALGIIATCPLKSSEKELIFFFPEQKWKGHLRYFQQHGLIQEGEDQGTWTVASAEKRRLLKRSEDTERFIQLWIDQLEPLRDHPDTAIMLSTQYIRLGKFDEAIECMTDVALGLEPSSWNKIYHSLFEDFAELGGVQKLSAEQKVKFYNSIGMCSCRQGNHENAIKWFLKLRRYSKRISHEWGIGQSYINCGVAYANLGYGRGRDDCFRKAITHAEAIGDDMLRGRSLHNIAMTLLETSPVDFDKVSKLLDESEDAKNLAGDEEGLIQVLAGRGMIERTRENYSDALKLFNRLEKAAQKMDCRYDQAKSFIEIGWIYFELEEFNDAKMAFDNGLAIAEEEEFVLVAVNCLRGIAVAQQALKHFKKGEKTYRKLENYVLRLEMHEWLIEAIHGQGGFLLYQGEAVPARRKLKQAMLLAEKHNLSDWQYRCYRDYAFTYLIVNNNVGETVAKLSKFALAEEKKSFSIAGSLWSDLINIGVEEGLGSCDIEGWFEKCISCIFQSDGEGPDELQTRGNLFAWRWDEGFWDKAIEALRELIQRAKELKDKEWQCRALEQLGTSLCELEQYEEAESVYGKALDIAKHNHFDEWTGRILGNLGELIRRTGRPSKAIPLLLEAERFAEARDDKESMIAIANNRALALEDSGKHDLALETLRSCRHRARQIKSWYEYVRAIHGIANLLWIANKPDKAQKEYRLAYEKAIEHEVLQEQPGIALNYSNALEWDGNTQKALKVLTSVYDDFEESLEAHTYFVQLAGLQEKNGQEDAAFKSWQKGKESAMRFGDNDSIALCAGVLSEYYFEAGKLELAKEELNIALEYETEAEPRMALFTLRLSVMLHKKATRRTSAIFDEARAFALEHGFSKDLMNLYIVMAEHEWSKKPSTDALLYYYVGMLENLQTGTDFYLNVEYLIASRLVSLSGSRWSQRVASFERAIKRKLTLIIEDLSDEGLHDLLRAFRIARQAHEQAIDLDNLTDNEYQQLIDSET